MDRDKVLEEIEEAFNTCINNMDSIKQALADAYKLIKGEEK